MKTKRVIIVNDKIVTVDVKEAKYLSKLTLKVFKADGVASFWDAVYILPNHFADESLIQHELQHIHQMHETGKLKFAFKYAWYLLRYGYTKNPYEIDARKAEHVRRIQ